MSTFSLSTFDTVATIGSVSNYKPVPSPPSLLHCGSRRPHLLSPCSRVCSVPVPLFRLRSSCVRDMRGRDRLLMHRAWCSDLAPITKLVCFACRRSEYARTQVCSPRRCTLHPHRVHAAHADIAVLTSPDWHIHDEHMQGAHAHTPQPALHAAPRIGNIPAVLTTTTPTFVSCAMLATGARHSSQCQTRSAHRSPRCA